MPIISVSALYAIKGAIVLAKSAAVKTALAKYGGYLISHYTVAQLVGAGVTVATVAGVGVSIASLPENVKGGFSKMADGLKDGSPATFLSGLKDLNSAYSTASGLIDDFGSFIDQVNIDSEVRISIKDTVRDLNTVIKSEIEGEAIGLLKEAENLLEQKGFNSEEYSSEVLQIYLKHTMDLHNDCSLSELLGRAGRIYSDLSDLNCECGIRTSQSQYDHFLAYCIAGWILDNKSCSCICGYSQESLAKAITDQIIEYLKVNHLD